MAHEVLLKHSERVNPNTTNFGSTEETTMYHTIAFEESLRLSIEVSAKEPLERVTVKKGARMLAQIRPHVIETEDGPVEVADLFFEDGTATRGVRFSSFSFADE